MRREGKSLFAKVEHGEGIGSQTQQKFQERPPQKATFIKEGLSPAGRDADRISFPHLTDAQALCMYCDVCMRGVIL